MSEREKGDGTPVPGWTVEFGTRIASTISALGGLRAAAPIAGVSDEQLGKWRDGKSKPSFIGVAAMAQRAGVSLDWLWSGQIQPEPAQAPPPSTGGIDKDLLARVHKGIAEVYREENARISADPMADEVARIYDDLVATYDSREERLTGLKLMLHQLRRELRTPPIAGTAKGKQAS